MFLHNLHRALGELKRIGMLLSERNTRGIIWPNVDGELGALAAAGAVEVIACCNA
jgi:hypothetical protein